MKYSPSLWAVALTFFLMGAKSAVVNNCRVPPSLWCSSKVIARECKVEQQCAEWLGRSANMKDAAPVNITVYIESLCPDCRNFMKKMLYPTWKTLESSGIMNLSLVPYGNAREVPDGNKWKFICQHGEGECKGNLLESCILYYEKFPTAFEIIYCMESSEDVVGSAESCSMKFGANFTQISSCAGGNLGNQLEHEMALITDALNPPHKYVPWVTLNGIHTEEIEKKAEGDLLSLVCDTYQGPKPDACTTQESKR